MRMSGRISIFMLFFLWLLPPLSAWAATDDDQGGILVGRIAHVEGGNLLRYVAESKDWVATVKDAPFGLEDALYAEHGVKAEFIMPNGAWIRIGGDTQVQMIALDAEATVIDVASGLARMDNKNPDVIIKATTPFGYVTAPADAVFDLYVGDESLEVIAVRGSVDFVHEATANRYEVREGDASLIADSRGVSRGNGTVDAAWDDWNNQRDSLWAKRLNSQGQGANYLPEPIRDESYVLEENGQWENVYYEGDYYPMWRPTSISSGWSPFTEGRWTVYYGDNCWIPAESFGYITHHYGSWVWVKPFKRWYWRPPVARIVAASPGLFIAFGWYPGRVGWIHHGSAIGWVPLAPNERYYGHRSWGRRVTVINRSQAANINIAQYRYLDRAIVIAADHLYRGNRYTPLIRRLDRTAIIKNYKPAAVLDKTVIGAYDTNNRRFAFSDANVERKPHATVLNRINDNRRLAQNAGTIGRQQIQENLSRTTATALPTAATAVSAPVVSSKMVAAAKMNQPVQSVSFPRQEIKPKERQRQLAARINQRMQSQPATGAQNDVRRPQSVRDTRGQVRRGDETMAPAPETSRSSIDQPPALKNRETSGQGDRGSVNQGNERQIRSPRDVSPQDRASSSWRQPQQPRAQETSQQQEIQRRQQEEAQRQQQEIQRRQEDQQRLQQQEIQRRQQEEAQRQQEKQRRQQEDAQKQQEMQRRQDEQQQRLQQQEMQRRQQERQQRLQQQEVQRQQQENAQRQQQEVQRRQKKQQQDTQQGQ